MKFSNFQQNVSASQMECDSWLRAKPGSCIHQVGGLRSGHPCVWGLLLPAVKP